MSEVARHLAVERVGVAGKPIRLPGPGSIVRLGRLVHGRVVFGGRSQGRRYPPSEVGFDLEPECRGGEHGE